MLARNLATSIIVAKPEGCNLFWLHRIERAAVADPVREGATGSRGVYYVVFRSFCRKPGKTTTDFRLLQLGSTTANGTKGNFATMRTLAFQTDIRLLLIPKCRAHMNWIDQPQAVISAMDEFFRGNWPAEVK